MNIFKIPFVKPFVAGAVVATRLVSSAPVVAQPVDFSADPALTIPGYDPLKDLPSDQSKCAYDLNDYFYGVSESRPRFLVGKPQGFQITDAELSKANNAMEGFIGSICILNTKSLGQPIIKLLKENPGLRFVFVPVTEEIINRHGWNRLSNFLTAAPLVGGSSKNIDIMVGLPIADFRNEKSVRGGCNFEFPLVKDVRTRIALGIHELSHARDIAPLALKGLTGNAIDNQLKIESGNSDKSFCPTDSKQAGQRRMPDQEKKAVDEENIARKKLGLPKRTSY